LKTFHIHIEGRVQGVGFRPFIYGLARSLSITGTVANTLEGVHIYANCSPALLENFITGIRTGAPEQSVITSLEYSEFSEIDFMEFNIVESLTHGFPDLLITPDFATCSSCRKELLDATNRRYQYPYITCTSCGPRFSIESALPYDRHRTSMFKFAMCKRCEKEYRTPSDRRFYSQTNSCPDCRVTQWITDNNGVRSGFITARNSRFYLQ
jgi:hydrogenase maturation protein HypF